MAAHGDCAGLLAVQELLEAGGVGETDLDAESLALVSIVIAPGAEVIPERARAATLGYD